MSKAHFVKQRKSKYRCKIDKCGKHHHSLLHEPEPPDKKHPQENKGQTLPVLVNSHHKSNCYLQVVPVTLSNISSDMHLHPNPIKVSHSWVVPHLDLPKSKILHNIHDWPHLSDIKTPTNNYDVRVLIGAEMTQLYLQVDTRTENTNDPIA